MIEFFFFIRAPDYSKAVEAAENILELFNRKPAIDNNSSDGDEIVSLYQYFVHNIDLFSV